MENRDQDKNQENNSQADISKAQSSQQPQQEMQSGSESKSDGTGTSETGQFGKNPNAQTDQSQTGQAGFGEASTDTETRRQSDVEGSSLQTDKTDQAGNFVGSKGDTDTSSELIEGQDFEKDGQGAPEGK